MLIDTTPANILEVLTVAITRQIILNHDNPWGTVASVACIAGLFAIRRFLIRRNELQEEMVEVDGFSIQKCCCAKITAAFFRISDHIQTFSGTIRAGYPA